MPNNITGTSPYCVSSNHWHERTDLPLGKNFALRSKQYILLRLNAKEVLKYMSSDVIVLSLEERKELHMILIELRRSNVNKINSSCIKQLLIDYSVISPGKKFFEVNGDNLEILYKVVEDTLSKES